MAGEKPLYRFKRLLPTIYVLFLLMGALRFLVMEPGLLLYGLTRLQSNINN